MNATLFDGGKVHRLNGDAAQCGVGKRRKLSQWQMDLGELTCLRCAKTFRRDAKKNPRDAGATT